MSNIDFSAPVCLIEPVISNVQPDPTHFPAIPQATNLQSAIAAINAMSQILRIITGQMTFVVQGTAGPAGRAGAAAPKGGRFIEQTAKRVVNTVKIAAKDDPTTFVEFKRIDSITMQDTKTKELWYWNRGQDNQ